MLGWALNLGFAGGTGVEATDQLAWGDFTWDEWGTFSWTQWGTFLWDFKDPYQIETGHAHVTGGNVGSVYIAGGAIGSAHLTGGNVGVANG